MELEIYKYINDYIKREYPMYYNYTRIGFYRKLSEGSLFKKYDIERIKNGDADSLIDDLINSYAQQKCEDVWNDFQALFVYVKNVVMERYELWSSRLNSKELDNMIRVAATSVIDAEDSGYDKYMDGSFDEKFLESFAKSSDKVSLKCINYMKNVINNSGIKFGYDLKTYDDLMEQVFLEIVRDNDLDTVFDGLCDKKIISKFNKYSNILKNKVRDYVKNLLDNYGYVVNPHGDIVDPDAEKIINYITDVVTVKGDVSVTMLFEGKLDEFITKGFEIGNDKRLQAEKYVLEKIKKLNSYGFSEVVLYLIMGEILDILREKNSCSYKSIISSEQDSIIEKIFNRKAMMYSSIVSHKGSNEVVHKPKKKKIDKKIIPLVLVAVISLNYFQVNNIVEMQKYKDAYSDVEVFSGFSYSDIYSSYNDKFEPTAMSAFEFYKKVIDAELEYENYSYEYLGFYLAYNNVKENRLHIMDRMLEHVQTVIKANPEYSQRYGRICNYDCYLQLVYNSLNRAGCKEVKKYSKIVETYSINNKLKDDFGVEDTVYNASSRYMQQEIEKLMELYREYCQEGILEFSDKLKEHNNDLSDFNWRKNNGRS